MKIKTTKRAIAAILSELGTPTTPKQVKSPEIEVLGRTVLMHRKGLAIIAPLEKVLEILGKQRVELLRRMM